MAVEPGPGPAQPASSSSPSPGPVAAPRPRPVSNPALRMLGLPSLPRKLPSRNWLLFWAFSGALATAIIYDSREKKRATAKWRRAVEPLAHELLASPNQLPRKLTIYLQAPPGDGLRTAQDHFVEYVKPVLAASGLDWDFVQGRQQGDVRAAVAEKIRRTRLPQERPDDAIAKTDETLVDDLRKKMGLPDYQGVKGDIVIGRHTWKEYIRGLHEGWLGPLDPPPQPPPPSSSSSLSSSSSSSSPDSPSPSPASAAAPKPVEAEEKSSADPEKEAGQRAETAEKTARPPQPRPHNSPLDYASAHLPAQTPVEFPPSSVVAFPHRLGFSQTLVRLGRFLNRRHLADDIGREVAAACFAAARPWRQADDQYEQQLVLGREERDWPKAVWQTDDQTAAETAPPTERIWASPVVVDARLAPRMRRFELQPPHELRASQITVPEAEIEGWMKGRLRALCRWTAASLGSRDPADPSVRRSNDDDDDDDA